MKKISKSKVLSLLLVLCMAIALMPTMAFAIKGVEYPGEAVHSSEDIYKYDIPKDEVDGGHLLDVSAMFPDDSGNWIVDDDSIVSNPCDKVSTGTAEGEIDITVSRDDDTHLFIGFDETDPDLDIDGGNRYTVRFFNSSAVSGEQYQEKTLEISTVNVDRELELREDDTASEKLDLKPGDKKTFSVYLGGAKMDADFVKTVELTKGNEKVATVAKDGDKIVVEAKAAGTTEVLLYVYPVDIYNPSNLSIPVTVADPTEADGSSDVLVSFAYNMDSYDEILINGEVVVKEGSESKGGDLLGYKDYEKSIGKYVQGSTNVTLYAEFIKYLQEEEVTSINVTFNDATQDNSKPVPYTIPVKIAAAKAPAPVVVPVKEPENPKTDASTNVICLSVLALIAVAGATTLKKKLSK